MNTRAVLLLTALTAATAAAQPFAITAQTGGATLSVAPGGTLNVAAQAIGSATQVRLNVSYRGTTSATITGVDFFGSGDFVATAISVPQTLTPGAAISPNFTFTPTTGQAQQAQLSVTYLESPATSPARFTINITATAPDLVYSYAFSGGNAQAIGDGALIQFPSTAVNATRTANFTVLNRGSAPGGIDTILLTGEAFQLGGLQVPPYTVNANSSLAFTVTFAPLDRTTQTATLTISNSVRTLKFQIQGTGTAADYSYAILGADGKATPVQAGQSISFPDTNTGQSATLTLTIANNGNGPGTINSISVVGAGFQLTSAPFLPATLAIGAQAQLTLTFAPATPGKLTGGLKIGDDTFTLAGQGIGPQLTYSYASGATNSSVNPGGSILFSPVQLGGNGTVLITVANTGNANAAVNTIFLTGSGAFALSKTPALPFNLAPNATATFNVVFTPIAIGVAQSSLQIGSATFAVTGSGQQPEPLPGITLSGPTGNVAPLQQPVFQLKLRQPYSIDLVGKLNLSFTSAVFVSDPALQFASGGRSVDFYIPWGTTDALFLNNSNQIAIQTGTVAGTINIFPTFATTNGIDLTPSNAPVLTLAIPQGAPQVTNLSIANQSNAGLTLQITGYTTSRSVTQITLTLTPAAGQNLSQTSFTIPVDTAFQAWYQASGSQTTGSAFTATLPLTLTGNSTAPAQLTKAIQSIAVTLTNAQGTSQSQSVTVP